jgi:hypothetical protein
VVVALAGCGGDEEPATETAGRGPELPATAPNRDARGVAAGTTAGRRPELPSLSPQAGIDLAIKAVLASGVPGLACERHSTERYVGTTFGGRRGCVQSTVPASAASAVEVSKVRIDGDEARAVAVPDGGPSSGERIRVELVRTGGVWKVDTLRSNAPVGP